MQKVNNLNRHLLIAATALSVFTATAREREGSVFRTATTNRVMAGCSAPQ